MPLTRHLRERGVPVTRHAVRPGRRGDAGRQPAGDRALAAVRRRADADAGRPAGAGREPAQRRRPGGGLRGPEAVHAVHRTVERHRDAGRQPAAAPHRAAAPVRRRACRSASCWPGGRRARPPCSRSRPGRVGCAVAAGGARLADRRLRRRRLAPRRSTTRRPPPPWPSWPAPTASSTEYWDWQGRHVLVPAGTIRAVLAAFDVDAPTTTAGRRPRWPSCATGRGAACCRRSSSAGARASAQQVKVHVDDGDPVQVWVELERRRPDRRPPGRGLGAAAQPSTAGWSARRRSSCRPTCRPAGTCCTPRRRAASSRRPLVVTPEPARAAARARPTGGPGAS